MKNWRSDFSRQMYLAVALVLSVLLVWVGAGSDNIGMESSELYGDQMATDSNGGQDYEEVLSAGDANNYVYIDWLLPKTTNEFSCAWFLGAYRFNDGSLAVDLDRTILQTQNLAYAISYSYGRAGASRSAALVLNLLNTNGTVLVESEDLLTSSNVIHYDVSSDTEGQTDDTVILINVPTAQYLAAAVLHLRYSDVGAPLADARSEDATITVTEGLLFIADGSDLWFSARQGNGTTNYPSSNSLSNFYDWVKGNTNGSSTNDPGGGGGGGSTNDTGGGTSAASGVIFVSQSIGSDMLTGRAPEVRGNDGPKKTISQGLAAVDQDGAHTLIIKSGNYGEDLDLRGKKNLRVVIEGRVRL